MKRNDFPEMLATGCAVCMGIGLVICVCFGLLSGEKTEASAGSFDTPAGIYKLQQYDINVSKNESVRIWTDPETGVQYLLYTAVGRGGICPRYNADGSLMVEGD